MLEQRTVGKDDDAESDGKSDDSSDKKIGPDSFDLLESTKVSFSLPLVFPLTLSFV
jgi:hypothetical protein